MSHILLDKMYIYPKKEHENVSSDFEYDEIKGYWKSKSSGSPLMLDKSAPKPNTKKCDVETGEDKKGE